MKKVAIGSYISDMDLWRFAFDLLKENMCFANVFPATNASNHIDEASIVGLFVKDRTSDKKPVNFEIHGLKALSLNKSCHFGDCTMAVMEAFT